MTSTPPDSGPDATPEFDESNRAVFGRICSYVYPNDRVDVWGVRENGRFVGHAEIKHTTDIDGFEIIYALARHAWGRVLGTELATRLVTYEFDELNLSEVHATVHPPAPPPSQPPGTSDST